MNGKGYKVTSGKTLFEILEDKLVEKWDVAATAGAMAIYEDKFMRKSALANDFEDDPIMLDAKKLWINPYRDI